MAEVQVDSKVEVITRTQFLGRLMLELVEDLMGTVLYSAEETIMKGIVENQYIDTITIDYIKGKRIIGDVAIEIDWDRHRLNIRKFGKTITYDLTKTAKEQISKAIVELIKFFTEWREKTGAHPELRWYWRRGIDVEEASERMGSKIAQQLQWHPGERKDVSSLLREREQVPFGDFGTPQAVEASTPDEIEYTFSLRPKKFDEILITGRVVDPEQVMGDKRPSLEEEGEED
jgi:hypothetical protein